MTNRFNRLLYKSCLKIFLLLPCAFNGELTAAEWLNFSTAPHHYTSTRQFAGSVCLPCHFQGIDNGTDLTQLITGMSDLALKSYLQNTIEKGNMPPDPIYREIVYRRFLQLK